MSEQIKRYDVYAGTNGDSMEPETVIDQAVRGDWVRFDDHYTALAAKDARIAELVEENDRLRARIANELCPRIPATPTEGGGEVPEVVAYVDEHGTTVSVGRQGAWISGHDRAIPDCWDRLMTFAQHSRIVAAKDAEIAWLTENRDEWRRLAIQQEMLTAEAHRRLNAKPARQVGGDERENFEAHFESMFFSSCFEREASGEYAGRGLQGAWLGWQARAALAPAEVEVGNDCYVQAVPEHCDRIIWRGHYYGLPITTQAEAVMPDRLPRSSDIQAIVQHNAGWNTALDEVARLNRSAIPVGLLERICNSMTLRALDNAAAELRALLGKEEGGQ